MNIESLLQTSLALIATLALIGVCAFGVRKLQSGTLAKTTNSLRVLAGTNVGAKERVVLMSVCDRAVLIGVTAGSISLLSEFDGSVLDAFTNPAASESWGSSAGREVMSETTDER